MKWFHKRISRKMAALTMVLLLGFLLLAGTILKQQAADELRESNHQRLITEANHLQKDLDAWLKEYITLVDAMTTNQDFLTILQEIDDPYTKHLHPLYQQVVQQLQAIRRQRPHISLVTVALAEANDLITDRYHYYIHPTFDLENRNWYQESIESSGTIITSPYLDFVTGEMIVSVSRTLRTDGREIGAVALNVEMKSLYEVMDAFQIGEEGYALISTNQQEVIYHPELPVLSMPGQYHLPDFYPPGFLSGESADQEARQFDKNGDIWYFSTTSLQNLPWQITVIMPKDEVMAPLEQLKVRYYQLMSGMMLFAALVALWISRKLSAPITSITKEINQYEHEKQMMVFPATYYQREDELGDLVRGLHEMSHTISQYTEELQAQNEELIDETRQRKEIQDRLELILKLLAGTQEATFILTREGRLLYGNEAFYEALQSSADTLENQEVLATYFHTDIHHLSTVTKGDSHTYQTHVVFDIPETYEQTLFHMGLRSLTLMDQVYYLGYLVNITQEQQQAQTIFRLQNIDPLTELYTASYIQTKAIEYLEKKPHQSFAYLLVNIREFRHINEARGHHYANQVLIQVANYLKKAITDTHVAARVGGDEFALFIDEADQKDKLFRRVKEISDGLQERFLINGETVQLKVAIGVAVYPDDARHYSGLVAGATSALNYAKEVGSEWVQFFNENLNKRSVRRFEMRNKLATALENQEFYLEYQPLVDMHTNQWVGLEALVRWKSDVGKTPPDVFIPLAEETEIILPLGEWILEKACAFSNSLRQKQFPGTISVNLSALQFSYPYLIQMVDKALEKSDVSMTGIELEITESLLMNNEQEGVKLLDELRSKGIKVSIDDFGTGYSSLSYLKKFKVDKIKIDRSFVKDIPDDDDGTIAKIIIELAESLQMEVVAEGVETKAQEAFLTREGCRIAQGYYYSKPLSEKEVLQALETR
ncbi:bifunctional diguanylate cyclase/phosphodiesterase [Tindallia californiensis]|uniref:Diguanylate cyclase (GGDEF) domain-containing protein n=1 Tax=Tindallia californiensis TaxID=159292 RepID=A0A1H3P5Y2_9FIRM|nr:EAL domain-containing protein [Tindallia californiensis]SDY96522.1 diguanylate cyclase (GGDEF) domain-containing protein [Tindallia californiensis]